jgi:pseudouridine kinase
MEGVTVIGGANMDIIALSNTSIKMRDSNPGKVIYSPGGVGRNIAENLARMGTTVRLIAAVGKDAFGRDILAQATECGIDTRYCLVLADTLTSTYMAIVEPDGEMAVAIAADAARLTPANLDWHTETIRRSPIVLMDANLDEDTIGVLCTRFPEPDIYIDTISCAKAIKIKNHIGKFHTIKLNALEVTLLAGHPVETEEDIERAAADFIAQGAKRIVISMGPRGLYYRTATERVRYEVDPITPKNATGAGDALMAGIIYCTLRGLSAQETVRYAHAMAVMALESEYTVNPYICTEEVEKVLERIA